MVINLHRIEEVIVNNLTWNYGYDIDKSKKIASDIISDINFYKDEIIFMSNESIHEEGTIK